MRRPSPPSLRRRILILAASMLLGAAGLLMTFISDYANRAADQALDRLLSAAALSIAGAVLVEDGAVVVEMPFAAFAMVSGEERVFYTVLGPQGEHVTGYRDLAPDTPLATTVDPVFSDIRHNGEPVRMVRLGRLISTAQGTGWVTIRVAETRGARAALAAEIVGAALVPVGVLTVLALALVWIVIGRAFAPLAVIDRALRQRQPDDLSSLDVPVPVEVQRLVGGLNNFMGRLEQSTARMGGLVAEAAHQVRNPLASLRAQSEMALDEPDAAQLRARVGRIHTSAVEASHLVTQLLMDATISHRMETEQRRPISITALVQEVVDRLDPDLRPRVGTDIGAGTDTIVVNGDRVGLREMLRNLIDNALAYSSGDIQIAVATQTGGMVRLVVRDRGPGITDADKARVLQRFVRGEGASGTVGSGLGLAIAQGVVAGHGGTLTLSDRAGGGLEVIVALPVEDAVQIALPRARRLGAVGAVLLAFALSTLGAPRPASADAILFPAPAAETQRMAIAGTTDTALFAPYIAAFQAENPGVAVTYLERDSLALYDGFLAGTLDPAPDVLISSASDLQMKLANDGHALAYQSAWLEALPAWAQWRAEVIGFTYEPAVIIYNPRLMPPGTQPRTHLDLAVLLEEQPTRFAGRVATYDIERSGVGYLLASQDQQISSQFWRLAAAFGRVRARLSDSSPAILDSVASGELILGYNVLGSYAFARQAAGARIGIIVPDDYVLVLTRSMVIPRTAPNPDLARAFVDFALSPAGQRVGAGPSALGAIIPDSTGTWTPERISMMGTGVIQPIALAPVLLVALDPQRRSRFLTTWQEIVAPGRP
ncbi:sensor histidine kinase [Yoonia vestfoldensis]|uniref:histidine kinase n=1 Tax=Yoonia vestfoldensis SKA53 TaxID=314232 RepID=A3V2X8_9RHOB|nr:extracellular solute-binding protein [Yoonia vestfoldensis]EAQ07709.1 putative periplasmic iron-binding protein [Yoonia vestfoldensis SKA53]